MPIPKLYWLSLAGIALAGCFPISKPSPALDESHATKRLGSDRSEWLTYYDPKRHFQFEIPAAWSLTTGFHGSGHYHDSFAGLNNFNKSDFWLFEGGMGPSREPLSARLPRGGLYVDLSFATDRPGYADDEEATMGGELPGRVLREVVVKTTEERHEGIRTRLIRFNKWRQRWQIGIYTHDPISPLDESRLTEFLNRFRFNEFPTGDPLWSVVLARQELLKDLRDLPDAGPFPLRGGRGYNEVRTWPRGDDVIVRFLQANPYREPHRAWEFQVTPTGRISAWLGKARVPYQTSEWGPDQAGLQCRFGIPSETEQGMPLEVAIRFGVNRDHIEADKKSWNTFLLPEFVSLIMKNTANGKLVTVRPFTFADDSHPGDAGRAAMPFDNEYMAKQHADILVFPLVTVWRGLEAGQYECRVQYSVPDRPTPWWDKSKDWKSFQFWHGKIETGPVPLLVHPAQPRKFTLLWPKRLHLGVDGGVYFREDDAVLKELPMRNGFFLGTIIHDDQNDQRTVRSGPPAPYHLSALIGPRKNRRNSIRSCILEVFETAAPPLRPWVAGLGWEAYDPYDYAGDSEVQWNPAPGLDDYQSLCQQSFRVEGARPEPHLRTNWQPSMIQNSVRSGQSEDSPR